MSHHKVIILGSGPAGLTAAIYAARANLSPVVIQGPTPGGQLTWTTEVENYPGFPKGVMGPELMKLMEEQAVRFGAQMIHEQISSVDLKPGASTLVSDKTTYTCDALIISTGATPKYLNVPGEQELMGYGVSTCATCDGAFFKNQIISVAGGGDSACEEALYLTRFGSKVYLIHRRDELRASKIMRERVLNHEKIEVLWNKQVKEIKGTKKEGLSSVVLHDKKEGKDVEVPVNAFFVAIGHSPNSDLFKGKLDMDENGYLTPKPNSTETNIPGVFACGDVQDHVFRQAITAAGTGCMAAIEAERYLESLGH